MYRCWLELQKHGTLHGEGLKTGMEQLTGAGVVKQVWSGVRWRCAGSEVGRKKLGSMGCMGNEHAVGKKVVARRGKRKAGAAVTIIWVL